MLSKGEQNGILTAQDSASMAESVDLKKAPDKDELKILVNSARTAARLKNWQEAARCWDAVTVSDPDDTRAYLGSTDARREMGHFDEAERIIGLAVARFPRNASLAIARAKLANARCDWPEALNRWESLRNAFPDNPWACLGKAQALRAVGQDEPAEQLLVTAESIANAANTLMPSPMSALNLRMEIARARADWRGARKAAQEILENGSVPSAWVLLMLAQACWYLEEYDAADDAALRALAVDPSLKEAVIVRAWVATAQGDSERALACYRVLVSLSPNSVAWALKVVQLLNWLGQVEEALRELKIVTSRWPDDPAVRAFIRFSGHAGRDPGRADAPEHKLEKELGIIVRKAPAAERRLREPVVDDPERDVLLVESARNECAVLLFTGTNDGLSIPLQAFDLYLAALPVTPIYVKDFKRLRYLLGIRSLSDDYEGTLAVLRSMLERLGAHRLCTIGNCEGGFAAIRYGLELGADRIIAFEPPTYSPADSTAKFEQARNFKRSRLAAMVPADMVDLKPFVEERRGNVTLELFYDELNPRDCNHAHRLAGLPGVNLHPQRCVGNRRAMQNLMLAHENFSELLGGLLGVRPAAASLQA